MGSIRPPIQREPGALILEVKRQGREAGNSPPTSAEVKKTWFYTLTPSCLHGVVLSLAQGQFYMCPQNILHAAGEKCLRTDALTTIVIYSVKQMITYDISSDVLMSQAVSLGLHQPHSVSYIFIPHNPNVLDHIIVRSLYCLRSPRSPRSTANNSICILCLTIVPKYPAHHCNHQEGETCMDQCTFFLNSLLAIRITLDSIS
jgi:hypothetical protein